MEKTIGYCGIACSDCPGSFVTRKDDEAERNRLAGFFTGQYRKIYQSEDINCDGCITGGPRISVNVVFVKQGKVQERRRLRTVLIALITDV